MNHMNTKQCARLGITTVQEKNLALEEKLVALEKEKERCQMPLGDVAVNLRENSGKLHLWINQSASRDFQTWFFLQDFACVASLSIPYCIVYLYVPYICIYLIKPYLIYVVALLLAWFYIQNMLCTSLYDAWATHCYPSEIQSGVHPTVEAPEKGGRIHYEAQGQTIPNSSTDLRWCLMSDLAVATQWRGHVHTAEREISHAGGLPLPSSDRLSHLPFTGSGLRSLLNFKSFCMSLDKTGSSFSENVFW